MQVGRFIIRLAGLAAFFALMAGLVYVYGGATDDTPQVSAGSLPVVSFTNPTYSDTEGHCLHGQPGDGSRPTLNFSCRLGKQVLSTTTSNKCHSGERSGKECIPSYYYKSFTIGVSVSQAVAENIHVTWWIPHPDCGEVDCRVGNKRIFPDTTTSTYGVDYVASGLEARQITIPANATSTSFVFLVIPNHESEDNKIVKIYLQPYGYVQGQGFTPTTSLVSVSTSPITVTIINDDPPDTDPLLGSYRRRDFATDSELGRIPIPPSPTPTPTPSPTPTPVPVDIVSQYDTNGNCKIDLDEYSRAIYDLQSRKITMDEMREIMSAMHRPGC